MPKRKAKYQYRSKFEERLGASLDKARVPFRYEAQTFNIVVPVRGPYCGDCRSKSIFRSANYTPDFFLPNIIVEAKGRFTAGDRKRALAFTAQHPNRRYGLLFMRDNTLSKTSETRYSDWCKAQGIPYAVGTFPKEWLE